MTRCLRDLYTRTASGTLLQSRGEREIASSYTKRNSLSLSYQVSQSVHGKCVAKGRVVSVVSGDVLLVGLPDDVPL